MRLNYMLTGVLLCAGLMLQAHPLHLTFTNLDLKSQNSRWVLTIKVFSDDFAANLKASTGRDLSASSNLDGPETQQILKDWLQSRLQIWFDSQPVGFETWKFEGIKVKEDASWLTYSFKTPLPVLDIRIRNTLLFDLYSDQKNLFIVNIGKFQSAHEFKNKDQETVIKLNK